MLIHCSSALRGAPDLDVARGEPLAPAKRRCNRARLAVYRRRHFPESWSESHHARRSAEGNQGS